MRTTPGARLYPTKTQASSLVDTHLAPPFDEQHVGIDVFVCEPRNVVPQVKTLQDKHKDERCL